MPSMNLALALHAGTISQLLGRFSHFIHILLMALQLKYFCISMKGIQNITKMVRELTSDQFLTFV